MPGAQCTRSLVCAMGSGVCTRVFTAEAPETSGIPHAMVLTAYFRALPGDEFLLATVAYGLNDASDTRLAERASARLDTSNGCQDHTSIFWHSVKHAETKKTL